MQPFVFSNRRLSRGFTLTEIAIVMALMGLILGAVWAAASGAFDARKQDQATQAVASISQGIQALLADNGSSGAGGNADITANMVASGVIPTNLVNGNAIKAPWNTAMYVLTSNAPNGAAGDSFTIVFGSIPKADCVALATKISGGIGGSTSLQRIYAGGAIAAAGVPANVVVASAGQGNPIAVATNAQAVAGCGNANTSSLAFQFLVKG